jgi:hypothetical protein
MNTNEPIKVIELRNYLIKPDARDKFIAYFERNFVESQNALGGFVLGAFRIKNEADRFFWIRGFSAMDSRSRFLPEFYGGEVWREFGGPANELMSEWHDVYLLKPLEERKIEEFLTEKSLTVIDFYFAGENKLGELVDLLQTKNNGKSSFWVSETAENDFPRLPVIQDENLLAAITNYKDEAESESGEKDSDLKTEIEKLVKKRERLVLTRAF